MDKQQIKRALYKVNNNAEFINVTHVAAVLGIRPETTQANYLQSLEYLPNGRGKLYLVDDVADAICSAKKKAE